ncbi:MAG: hypothetical protein SGPRY_007310, partial [Prymnesium sp.]
MRLLLLLLPAASLAAVVAPLARAQCILLPRGGGSRHGSSPLAIQSNPESTQPQQPSKAEPLSPQNAIKEFGPLLEQVKLVWTEGSTWSPEERAERRRDIVEKYVRVFAPALAFSAAQLGLSLFAFAVVLIALNLSGRGFNDLADALSSLPLLEDLISKVDPAWGNAAIALVVVEVLAPLLLPVAIGISPGIAQSLQNQLEVWGIDADGLNARIEK